MKVRFVAFLVFAFCISLEMTFAQSVVSIASQNAEIQECARKARLYGKVRNRETLDARLADFSMLCRRKGYLTFSVDSVAEDSSAYTVFLFEGPKFSESYVEIPSGFLADVQHSGWRFVVRDSLLPVVEFADFSSRLLSFYENHGYPFAEVYLDEVDFSRENVVGNVVIDKHNLITMDSVVVKGNAKIRPAYLYPYLGIRRKGTYDESVMRRIPQKVAEMPFATQLRPSGVEFVNDKAEVYLFLDRKKTNAFDGFIALVPTDERTGKVGVAGELNLSLKNVLGIGEGFDVLWRCPMPKSQFLNVKLEFPFLFRTPLGFDASFLLDKTDTTYLTMDFRVGLRYSVLSDGYVKAYFDYSSSNVLNLDLLRVSNDDWQFADYKSRMYGVSFSYRRLDYLYNPRKGVDLMADLSAGRRSLVKNPKADPQMYDDVRMSVERYRFVTSVSGYVPLHRRWVLRLDAKGGALFGSRNFYNDLFKLGGMNSLRGFGEDEILASSYAMALAEIRFLFAKIAYFNLFANVGWYEQNVDGQYVNDVPRGFGVGVTFDTKAGLFFLDYALGQQFDNPISLKNGKVYFGLSFVF